MKKNSPEFRQMQRERIMKNRPWEKSTGAKTPYGKERSKMNALKVPSYINDINREYKKFMQEHRAMMNKVLITIR